MVVKQFGIGNKRNIIDFLSESSAVDIDVKSSIIIVVKLRML
jgi:hypothetical protein